jgi:hypothetical protein
VKSQYGAVSTSGLSTDHSGVRAVAEAFGYTPEELAAIVLREAFRVLRPGGRLQMADILLHEDVTPEQVALLGEWSD